MLWSTKKSYGQNRLMSLLTKRKIEISANFEGHEAYNNARNYEAKDDFVNAVTAWRQLLDDIGATNPKRLSYLIEFLYAVGRATGSAVLEAYQERPMLADAVRIFEHQIKSDQSFDLERPAIFKGLDVLKIIGKFYLAPQMMLRAQADIENDSELRDKFFSEFYNVTPAHQWVWMDGVLDQRIRFFNEVILDYCDKSKQHHIDLYLKLKHLEITTLCSNAVPTASIIRETINAYLTGENCAISNVIPSQATSNLAAFLDVSLVRMAISLAFFHPNVLIQVHQKANSVREFEISINEFAHLVPRYQVITKLSYPMGGGESFMHQSCMMLNEFGFRCTWVSFTDKNGTPYQASQRSITPYYLDVRLGGGMNEEAIASAIRDYGADILHTQGISNEWVARIAKQYRIPCLVGFHFWNGLVDLGIPGNKHIIQNIKWHKIHETVPQSRDIVQYVASEFMLEVYQTLGGNKPLEVFHPVSDPSHYSLMAEEHHNPKFVVQVNLAEGKGGETFLYCLKALDSEQIPFLGVHSESVASEIFNTIHEVVSSSRISKIESYGPAGSIYSRARIVIIPTKVDETFCRVAYEAAVNGIPVLSTRAGFIPYMMDSTGYYLPDDDDNAWVTAIRALYHDEEQLKEIGSQQRAHVLEKFGKYPRAFLDATIGLVAKIPRKNIGFFTVWGDQGLGYQVRHYSHLLKQAGFNIHIFSFLPYKVLDLDLVNQHDIDDWACPKHADSVYYSFNSREHVPPSEITQFVNANRVGLLVYPEICWKKNWDKVAKLNTINLFVAGVPNLETVRQSEAKKHNMLWRTFCPTHAIENILYSHGVSNTFYIGHGFGAAINARVVEEKIQQLRNRGHLSFLHIGGHNPRSRKQTPQVIAAFLLALESRDDIHLTVTVMDAQNIIFFDHPNIHYVTQSLGHAEIMDLYIKSDVSIQVSSHEGVGMGFYESIAAATPVISLDVPPHNEVVLEERTGWLLQAQFVSLPDNDDPVSRAALFHAELLAEHLVSLTQDQVEHMIRLTAKAHQEKFDDKYLSLRLVKGLP